MYVVPFSMGPLGSPISHIGVQLTDSAYVAVSMRIMTRMGAKALDALGSDGEFVPCVHSVGAPLAEGEEDVPWPCNETKYIVHYPETREIWSYGSGYGGNALLGKKCFALRIASAMARDEGWMAEHMLILKLTSPEGEVKYVTGAFPSACGKTNLAMLIPTLPDWKVETVGDDIAWMKFGEDGRLYAVNPEAGFFGVAPGTGHKTNPNAMATIERNTIFTNTAETEGDVWWEGMTGEPPDRAIDWKGNEWTPDSEEPAAHPNARFTDARLAVPVDRRRVGGPRRRADRRLPLRRPPRRRRAARLRVPRLGARRVHRRDHVVRDDRRRRRRRRPAALRPDGDAAVLRLRHGRLLRPLAGDRGEKDGAELPKIFHVNWFRKDDDGKFLWPGFGENSRVLEWVFRRCDGEGETVDSPLGLLPAEGGINTDGLDISAEAMNELLTIDEGELKAQLPQVEEHLARFPNLPDAVSQQLEALKQRLA